MKITQNNYRFNGSVTDDTFRVFKNANISEISLQDTQILTLTPNAFSYFPKLQSLVITCSRLLGLSPALAAVQNLNTQVLHTLVLDGLGGHGQIPMFSQVTYSNFCSKSTLSIKRLCLRGNKIIFIDCSIFNSTCLPMLEYIALGYNTILAVSNRELFPLMNITNLRTVDVSHYGRLHDKKLCIMKDTDDYFQNEPNLPKLLPKDIIRSKMKANIFIPPSVEFIYADHAPTSVKCHKHIRHILDSSNNIRFANMSNSIGASILCIPKFLPTVQYIDASNIQLAFYSDRIFKYIPNIMYLNLKNNFLGVFNNRLTFTRYTPKLRSLDISNNRYSSIHFDDLNMLQNLETLIIADNSLGHITFNTTYMISLNYFDISGNKLTSLDHKTQDKLETMARQQNITINLSDNPFICDCNTIHFIRWIQATNTHLLDKENYLCKYKNKNVPMIHIDSDKLEIKCFPKQLHKYKMPLIIRITTLVFLMGITATLYNFKWILKYKFHRFKRTVHCICHGGRSQVDNPVNDYNVCVINDPIDREWTENVLQPKLEEEWRMKLFMKYRNHANRNYGICEEIALSDKTILVLSNYFITDNICEFALQMAIYKGLDTLIICIMEELDVNHQSKSLRQLLLTENIHSMKWTDNENEQQDFWDSLKVALNKRGRD